MCFVQDEFLLKGADFLLPFIIYPFCERLSEING